MPSDFSYFSAYEPALDGPPPTWRAGYASDEPIWRELVAELGDPTLDGAPAVVLVGQVVPA